jgi:pimeloyl-ACP methyl ester carboxylesterase
MTGQRRDAPRFAVNGDVRLAYDDPGPPVGEPLILIMGVGAFRFWWPAALIGVLQQRGFHVVVFDLRDSGESTHLSGQAGVGAYRAMFSEPPGGVQRRGPRGHIQDLGRRRIRQSSRIVRRPAGAERVWVCSRQSPGHTVVVERWDQ